MKMKENNQLFSLEDIMGDRFAKYSKYIIQDRALPDVRDGLKPVQRRILYAMYKEGNTFNKPHRKSAKTVGNVIGNFHPHGDTSVYDAMVRMSQWWKVREPLIDMHGNNGSLDNDPPAAMRYTEARLSAIASEMLKDIEKECVTMAYNFDDTELEPTVLPARFPALLVNGAKGIAAGYATDIPPHNLSEVIDATIYRIKNPNCLLHEVMQLMKGPDFPTGGIVQGKEGIIDAFMTGRGKCVVRAKTEIVNNKNENQIIVTEIPYEVVKSDLVRDIDQIRFDKAVDGILEVRDESDKDGLRIAIDIRKDVDADLILNYLFKKTSLQINYNYNVIAINNKRPMQLGLLAMLDAYIKHQIDVDTRRTKFDLNKAQNRLHIIEGLVIAINNLDEVIRLIRASVDKAECKTRLIERFNLTEKQAEAVVSLQLYRLSSTDINTLLKEKNDLEYLCLELNSLLNDEKKLRRVIINELTEVKKKYGNPRRTALEAEVEEIVIDKLAMIPKEDVMISISKKGYCKRSSIKSFSSTEALLPDVKDDDLIIGITKASTVDTLLIFTTQGNYLYIPVYELTETRWRDEGVHINNIVTLASEEYILGAILVSDFEKDISIALVTKNGQIKKTKLNEFKATRYTKPIRCMRIADDDEVVDFGYLDGDSQIVVLTDKGNALRYHEENVSLVGIRAGGIKAINDVKKSGYIVGMAILHTGELKNAFLVTNKGGVKVIDPRNINMTNRTNKVTPVFKCFKSDPHNAIYLGLLPDEKKGFALSTSKVYELDLNEKPQPFEKNIKGTYNLANKETFILASNNLIEVIDENTKVYEPTSTAYDEEDDKNGEETNKEPKKEEYETISILDLLGEDF